MSDDKYILKLTPIALLAWAIAFGGVAVIALTIDDSVAAIVLSASWAAVVFFAGLGVQAWTEYGPSAQTRERAAEEAAEEEAAAAEAEAAQAPIGYSRLSGTGPPILPHPQTGLALRQILEEHETLGPITPPLQFESGVQLGGESYYLTRLATALEHSRTHPHDAHARGDAFAQLITVIVTDRDPARIEQAISTTAAVLGVSTEEIVGALAQAAAVAEDPQRVT